jgi:transposase
MDCVRGKERKQHDLFSFVSPEKRVPAEHPLRPIKKMAEAALAGMSGQMDGMYSEMGRASIPPERLLKAMLLIALYSIRSERLFCEELNYNLLYRWFLNMSMDEPSFHASTFSKNRERFLEHDVTRQVFAAVVEQARAAGLMSRDHFSVDGSLIEAWASLKSFRPKDEKRDEQDPPDDPGNPSVNFRGEKRSNETHASTTDPEAKLARKGDGKEAKLSYSLHSLMENRNGLLVDLRVDSANGIAERFNAISMLEDNIPGAGRITVAADKGYDDVTFVAACRTRNVTPHVAQNLGRSGGSAIDGRTTQSPGYQFSQRVRKRIEEIFGWLKTVGGFRRTRFRGRARTQMAAYLAGAAYNLTRMQRLGAAGP